MYNDFTLYMALCVIYIYVEPILAVEVMAISMPVIDEPLTLQCTANIVRGITDTVDIIWTSGDTQVRRVNNVIASSNINSTSVYNDSFIIPSLSISDIGNIYQCEVLINLVIPTRAKTDFIIPIPGTYSCMYMFMLQFYHHLYWKCKYTCVCTYVCI